MTHYITINIPIKLPSLANVRLHWRAMDRLKAGQKELVSAMLFLKPPPPLPIVVTLTRIGKRMLDDDNLASAFKYVRDQIARSYGFDDGSNSCQWRYAQRIGKVYSIEIEIETL